MESDFPGASGNSWTSQTSPHFAGSETTCKEGQELQPLRPATRVSWALRARSASGVSLGVSLEPFGPRAPECPKSVPRVSRGVKKVSWTLRGHSRDTFWTLRSPAPEGRRDTPRDNPGTLRARRARETPVAGRGGGGGLQDSDLTSQRANEIAPEIAFFGGGQTCNN